LVVDGELPPTEERLPEPPAPTLPVATLLVTVVVGVAIVVTRVVITAGVGVTVSCCVTVGV